jgi:two-component system, chemotaxis family, sensor kinase CheA
MPKKDDQFLKKLLAAFRIEADEHLRAIANGLLELEKAPTGSEKLVESMYREAHSLKGAARSVNMTKIESVCQVVESVFAALKAGRLTISTELFDTLHKSADIMAELLDEPDGVEIQSILGKLIDLERSVVQVKPLPKFEQAPRIREEPPSPPQAKAPVEEEAVAEPLPDHPAPAQQPAEADAMVKSENSDSSENSGSSRIKDRFLQSDTVRISVNKLDPLLRQVGEMVSVKLTASQRVSDLAAVVSTLDQWKQKWNSVASHGGALGSFNADKRKSSTSGKQDGQLVKLLDFLEWNQDCIKSLEQKIRSLIKSAEGDARLHGTMVDDLLEDMMNVLMLPCSSLLEIFPKLVRDLSRDAEKEVNLDILGADLEIDRRILEEMKDPLIHLVRNCIDHGIEHPEERLIKGKQRQGTLTIAISQISGNQVEIVVSDDGAGIDVSRVREAARKRGMITEQEKLRLEGQEAVSLVFRSDVSTSPVVSNISGRGLGLAIVREKVENLGGHISVATAPEVGASFRILLPVTLSTFRGILVSVSEQLFVIPTASVERVARIKKDVIKTVGNRDTIEVNGRAMPLVRLADALELDRVSKKSDDSEYMKALILRSGETLVAFSVEAVLQEQEVLVKGLGKQLSRVRNIAGATVLGSGKLAPILNVQDLVKSAMSHASSGIVSALQLEQLDSGIKSVLVVEDSITSRMLLKNILESSGYQVTTSVDGLEAWNLLKNETFDLVVSDVEMPRMDGFQLTANIRSDEKLGTLPVVLVTSLGSREDKERGIDVGANAYIVKGSFDQNNLLETLDRLI